MRLLIISNRLPVTIQEKVPNPCFKRSIGGLVTGIESYIKDIDEGKTRFNSYLWIGWPGAFVRKSRQEELARDCIESYRFYPVYLTEEIIRDYYIEYCNKTLWPLFHNFPNYVNHNPRSWEAFECANESFYRVTKKRLRKDDLIWIHDYHLMLLPGMLRKDFPNACVTFFLHIPFPAVDIFRHLPNAEQVKILEGLLGADVIGFHTYGYAQDFLECVRKILKLQLDQNEILWGNRRVKVGVFPMGIDCKSIASVARSPKCVRLRRRIQNDFKGKKVILSVDRLDYTKGIVNRLAAFDRLLTDFPEWKGKTVLILIVAPSRREIDAYQQIKRSIDELVGNINGTHGSNTWVPVIYQYKQFNLLELCALYGASSLGMVTPLRDGMNLIAKEFVAAHTDERGVLILSEMAGAIHDLPESVSVNPYSIEEMVGAILTGLNMPAAEQQTRIVKMQQRLREHDVCTWAHEIVEATLFTRISSPAPSTRRLDLRNVGRMMRQYKKASNPLFLFDYDGTLSPFVSDQSTAKPGSEMLDMLSSIADQPGSKVAIISGRDRKTMDSWFGGVNIVCCSDLGAYNNAGGDWKLLQPFDREWKGLLRPLLEKHSGKLPFSFVEEKECALVWDFRMADKELSKLRVDELLEDHTINLNGLPYLDLLRGENSLILRNKGSNKSDAARMIMSGGTYDFILAIGDDDADEEMFRSLPDHAFTVRVGSERTSAAFCTQEQHSILDLLSQFANFRQNRSVRKAR